MVGIVVVSHNEKLAQEIIHFVSEMKRFDFPLLNVGGTNDGNFGSDPIKIKQMIEQAYCDEGVFIFVDIGSSILNTQMALDFLDQKFDRTKVIIADAPIVEGTLIAVSANCPKNAFESIIKELENLKSFKKV